MSDFADRPFSVDELLAVYPLVPAAAPRQMVPVGHARLDEDGFPEGLSKRAMKFLLRGAPEGSWNPELYNAARDWYQQGGTYEGFVTMGEELAQKFQGALDESDHNSICSAFSKPPKHPPRVGEVTTTSPFKNKDELPYVMVKTFNKKTKEFEERRHYPTEPMVFYWLDVMKAEYNYRTDTILLNGYSRRIDKLITRIILDADNVPVRLDRDAAARAVGEWKDKKRGARLDELRETVRHRPSGDALPLIGKFLGAISEAGPSLPEDAIVLLHFIWQVKRKLFNLPVTDHMMPLLYGKTGGGKSTAAFALFKPLEDVLGDLPNLASLNDARELELLTKNFILFTEEMARSQAADVSLLKTFITSETVTQRVMRTTDHATSANTATFFGCANKELIDLIYDPTGVRRFWQINCANVLHWETINTFDALPLWQAVDEGAPSPIKPYLSRISSKQHEEFRNKDSVELFMEDKCELESVVWEKASTVYLAYKQYCEDSGIKSAMSARTFSRRLSALGIQSKRNNGTKYNLALVNEPI